MSSQPVSAQLIFFLFEKELEELEIDDRSIHRSNSTRPFFDGVLWRFSMTSSDDSIFDWLVSNSDQI